MTMHIRKEMEKLQKKFLAVAEIVEESVLKAIEVVSKRDAELAKEINRGDKIIDRMEVELEEECLKIIALYQPVAVDLRVLVAVLKINNDLERIADLATNIAKAGSMISPGFKIPFDYQEMANKVQSMLRLSMEAIVELDPEKARKVCSLDDEVDDMKSDVISITTEKLKTCSENTGDFLQSLSIAKHLERVADLATNIAEEVVYIVEGKIIRHGLE